MVPAFRLLVLQAVRPDLSYCSIGFKSSLHLRVSISPHMTRHEEAQSQYSHCKACVQDLLQTFRLPYNALRDCQPTQLLVSMSKLGVRKLCLQNMQVFLKNVDDHQCHWYNASITIMGFSLAQGMPGLLDFASLP